MRTITRPVTTRTEHTVGRFHVIVEPAQPWDPEDYDPADPPLLCDPMYRTTVHVFGAPEPDTTPRYTQRGQDPAADAAWDAYNTTVVANQRAVLREAAPGIDAAFGTTLAIVAGWDFSRHAGCGMCPCSPGFITQDRPDHYGLDVFITVQPT